VEISCGSVGIFVKTFFSLFLFFLFACLERHNFVEGVRWSKILLAPLAFGFTGASFEARSFANRAPFALLANHFIFFIGWSVFFLGSDCFKLMLRAERDNFAKDIKDKSAYIHFGHQSHATHSHHYGYLAPPATVVLSSFSSVPSSPNGNPQLDGLGSLLPFAMPFGAHEGV
jgi:hypothetical protein